MNEIEKCRPNQSTFSKRNWWKPVVCSAFLVVATTAHAASIFTNPITNSNPSASNPFNSGQTVGPNATATGIGRGAGLTANAGGDRYNAASWNLPSLDPTDYFTWTMTPNSGYELDFASFVYTGQRSNTGPNTFAFRSSVDGFTSNIGAPTATGTTIDLSAPAFQGVTAAIEFRLYGWGGTGASGTFSVNDFTFNGTVDAITVLEPASFTLVMLLGLIPMVSRRRLLR